MLVFALYFSLGASVRRRELISLVGGAAILPLAARAQQREQMRHVAVLMGGAGSGDNQVRLKAFLQALHQLGWIEGRNLRIDTRWAGGTPDGVRKSVTELVALSPDVIVTSGSVPIASLLQRTRTVPIVFTNATDPVGAGFVESLAHPGGNATGFMQFDYGLSAKWLELLKEISPRMTRAAVLRDPDIASGIGQFAVIQSVAPGLGIDLRSISVRDAGVIERAIAAFARLPNGGLIVTTSSLVTLHRDLIIALAARHKLPAVYYRRLYVARGGLISYGSDVVGQFRLAAGYVDRILKGENPANLPVQAPTKYELVVNVRTAGALGLTVPESILARADEVIE